MFGASTVIIRHADALADQGDSKVPRQRSINRVSVEQRRKLPDTVSGLFRPGRVYARAPRASIPFGWTGVPERI